jgi:predicted ATP-dependent endonuclease of OLD family
LQRKLLRYLKKETDNHYLVATHSAHMLDFGTASISAARLVEGKTVLSPVISPGEVATISFELGARASDLVQSNSVIWVEGPADRIYLLRWLRAVDKDLVEGIDFSILTYGGRLLSHITAVDDPAIEEFIRLPRINRHFAVVIDSDRTTAHQPLGSTKTRVRKEIEAVPGAVAWITKGYTIENYVPEDQLSSAIRAVHPTAEWKWSGEQFTNPLALTNFKGRKSDVDKVAIAIKVAARPMTDDAWILDLRQRVGKLVRMIQDANS